MTFKQTGIVLVVLIILAAIIGLWASYAHAPVSAPAGQTTAGDLLGGTATSTGQMEYRELSDCFDITADYPATTSLPAAADAKARAAIETNLKQQIDQFKSENDISQRSPDQVKALGICTQNKFTLKMTYQSYQGSSTISYLYSVFADSLGAHPNAYFITFTFDQNGNEVTLPQLLGSNPNWLQEVSDRVTKGVTSQLQQRLGQQDVSSAMFADGLAPDPNNFQDFVIDGDTLVIEIPPYQAAAWAVGTFEVRIPLSDLQK